MLSKTDITLYPFWGTCPAFPSSKRVPIGMMRELLPEEHITGLISTLFWGFSAGSNVPLMTYKALGELPEVLNRIARLNRWAAAFAAASAVFVAASIAVGILA